MPLVHGAQSGTRTGPATPRAATWTCAAMALPLRLLNSSRHDISAPVAVFASVAANVPCAPLTSPLGDGVSFAAVMFAAMRIVLAWLRAAAPPTVANAHASASATASKWNLVIHTPPPLAMPSARGTAGWRLRIGGAPARPAEIGRA